MSLRDSHRDIIVRAAFAAAWADGAFSDDERQALSRIMLRLGFQLAEIESKIGAALEGPQPAALDLPADKASALEIMRYALAVMLADGSLSQEEVTFLIKLGAQLGVDSATLSSLGREAERLLSARTAHGGRSSIEKIDALLPETSLNPPEASDFF